MAFPWLLKPFIAFASDRFPIFGYRRKSYMVIFSLLTSITWVSMPHFVDDMRSFYVLRILENFFLCCFDVALDSLIVERIKRRDNPRINPYIQTVNSTLKYVGKCTGSIMSAIMFFEGESDMYTFYMTAIPPLISFVCSFWIREHVYAGDTSCGTSRGDDRSSISRKCTDMFYYVKMVWRGFYDTCLFRYCAVITWYTFVPDPDAAYFFYYQDTLNIPSFKLQMISLSRDLGMLVGTIVFLWKFTKIRSRMVMLPATLVICGLHMYHALFIFMLNPSNDLKIIHVYCIAFVTCTMDAFIYMPLYIMGAKMSTVGVEGTSYALIHSIAGIGQFANDLLASRIIMILGINTGRVNNIWYMSFFTAFLYLSTLLFLDLLPNEKDAFNPHDQSSAAHLNDASRYELTRDDTDTHQN
jgi:hypothetical protein